MYYELRQYLMSDRNTFLTSEIHSLSKWITSKFSSLTAGRGTSWTVHLPVSVSKTHTLGCRGFKAPVAVTVSTISSDNRPRSDAVTCVALGPFLSSGTSALDIQHQLCTSRCDRRPNSHQLTTCGYETVCAGQRPKFILFPSFDAFPTYRHIFEVQRSPPEIIQRRFTIP